MNYRHQQQHQQQQSDKMTPQQSPQHGHPMACLPPSPTSVLMIPTLVEYSGTMSDFMSLGSEFSASKSAAVNAADSPLSLPPQSPMRITGAVGALLAMPFVLYRGVPSSTLMDSLRFIHTVWDSLLHFSSIYIALLVLVASVYFAPCVLSSSSHQRQKRQGQRSRSLLRQDDYKLQSTKQSYTYHTAVMDRVRSFCLTPDGFGILLALAIVVPIATLGSMPALFPSWVWYPLAWQNYHIYRPSLMATALEGICVDQAMHDVQLPRRSFLGGAVSSVFSAVPLPVVSSMGLAGEDESRRRMPLCLPESSWETLSTGVLSSYKAKDVRTVMRGVDFARQESHGLAIGVLARDVKEYLEAFRTNVESLRPFFRNLAVVIFENDSSDGSRDAIREWASLIDTTHRGYSVDLIECDEAVDCKFGKHHRDSDTDDYANSKAVGDMDIYRQRVTDHITERPEYESFSHMLVLDIDLAVSLSPFGVLHTLGKHPENAVASSGRQLYPMGFGSMVTPYDFSAFRPWATEANNWVLGLHERWCAMMPPGDRWRNSCDAPSPFMFAEMVRADRGATANKDDQDFYRVQSAFNGAVLYPLDLVRVSQASYDAGEDGQRCEHIGFNLALQAQKPMFVNRKWDMHVDPLNPGGPTGWRAQNAITNVTGNLKLLLPFLFGEIFGYFIFIYSITMVGIFLVYPLISPLTAGSRAVQRLVSSHHRKQQKMKSLAIDETLFKLV